MPGLASVPSAVALRFSPGAMFLFFLKVWPVLIDSGYVVLAFLRADLIERRLAKCETRAYD